MGAATLGSDQRTDRKAAGKARETAGAKQRLWDVERRKEMWVREGPSRRIWGKPSAARAQDLGFLRPGHSPT